MSAAAAPPAFAEANAGRPAAAARLERLGLASFRNYEAQEADFPAGAVLVTGPNGSGKSNLIEAIFLLARGRSLRTRSEAEMIRFGADLLRVSGRAERDGAHVELSATLARGNPPAKGISVNGRPLARLSGLLGRLPAVAFTPEDLSLVRGGPEARRAFLDALLSQLSSAYLADVVEYHRVLKNRNAVLRRSGAAGGDEDELAAWTEPLVSLGARIVRRRLERLPAVARSVAGRHAALCDGREVLTLEYRDSLGAAPLDAALSEADLQDRLRAEIVARCGSERERGISLVGPHRDDLLLRLDGAPARAFASQGQCRGIALSLRHAELELLTQETGTAPVVLLDDVLSELDPVRLKRFSAMLSQTAQTFVTGTDAARLREVFPRALALEVRGGRLFPCGAGAGIG